MAGLPPQPEIRKTVTVLFCDVTGSTELGEQLDPEPLRRVLFRYFDEMRTVLERHGGTVEKFIGDAVMAVFGVPTAHEDDALRAVRAATEMRAGLDELNEELDREWGVRLESRMGINTGEVVTGAGHTLATGDPVNVAARLQQAAAPGEILLGKETYTLVAHAVDAGPLETFSLRGKREGVARWRLKEVAAGARAVLSRAETPLVGRKRERAVLDQAYERIVTEDCCELVTLLGAAGVGKSRLTQEFTARLLGASVLQGRCLAYGDGITFWPVSEIVREAAGITDADSAERAREKIGALVRADDDTERVCERVAEAVGLAADEAPTAEVFLALRRLFEALAASRPLVLVFEDIQWAEPTLLDLLEYLVAFSSGAPILLVCLARPELLETRSSFGEAGTRLALDPLDEDETLQLIADRVGVTGALDAVGARVSESAEGNPLFVEELLRMLVDEGVLEQADGGLKATCDVSSLSIPPTINALLAARLDRLEPEERAVIQRAAVMGKQFWWSAVAELAPGELRDKVGPSLHALVRKKLIVPEESIGFVGEDAFRFAHILARDAAYQSLPKELRAELHERYAEWLERRVGERAVEYEEILGYHLESGYRARAELGPLDDHAHELGRRGGELLGSAGRRAIARGDMPAAATLLERATSLLPSAAPLCRELLLDLVTVLRAAGRLTQADETLRETVRRAEAASDRRLQCRARLEQAVLHTYTYPEKGTDELLRVADSVIPAFQELGDDIGVARAWILIAEAYWLRCRIDAMEEALDRALKHAELAGGRGERRAIWNGLGRAALAGATPVEQALRRCREIAEQATSERSLEAVLGTISAYLEAMRGRFAQARELYAESQATLADLGQTLPLAALQTWSGAVELLAGDPQAAEAELRAAFETLEAMGEKANLATIAASLAAALYQQGRDDDAAELTRLSERLASHDDLTSQIEWRAVRAKVLARQGQLAEAERLARESVSFAVQTDCPNLHGDALLSLGETLVRAQRDTEAHAAFAQAHSVYEMKGNGVMAAAAAAAAEQIAALSGATRTSEPD